MSRTAPPDGATELGARAAVGLTVALVLWVAGCAAPAGPREPLRVSSVATEGDPQRNASIRLVLRGLDEDASGGFAVPQYERALQVDPTNPWAYLALARHELDAGAPERALQFLDEASSLVDPADERAAAHFAGLRGVALSQLGRGAEAAPLLERARELAPREWQDGSLDASELR